MKQLKRRFIRGVVVTLSCCMLAGCGTSEGNVVDTNKEDTIEGEEVSMSERYSSAEYEEQYTYQGEDLGAVYDKTQTAFRVWAPEAESVKVRLYEKGDATVDDCKEELAMEEAECGTWTLTVKGDLVGTYYTYVVTRNGKSVEACDPYARATGINGNRAMVIDLEATNPTGWENDVNPNAEIGATESIIYEIHIRDISIDESSGISNKGKFIGLTETGTTNAHGDSTGLDYLKELGITHVQILPMFDFGYLDEADTSGYNWGYGPKNYNVPEGSYSTDPYNGEVRVKEMKQMIQALHSSGLSVVMDVVYNHVYDAEQFCVNQIVPGYFSRIDSNGNYSNGSICGNDVATERAMVKKYIVDSVLYWMEEYHIDGFRFDLQGLLDVELMNEIAEEIHSVRSDVLLYGEGWEMSSKVTKKDVTLSTMRNCDKTPAYAFFNDSIRDLLRGRDEKLGYISGAVGNATSLLSNLRGTPSWATHPYQLINYASCHDDMTLYDFIQTATPGLSEEEKIKQNKMAAAIVFASQGVPFVHAGEELLRTKVNPDGSLNNNSYESGDEVNAMRWNVLAEENYQDTLSYYQGLIEFRKQHPALHLSLLEEVESRLSFDLNQEDGVILFTIDGTGIEGEDATGLLFCFNASDSDVTVQLPEGTWQICVSNGKAGTDIIETVSGSMNISAMDAVYAVQ